MILAIDVQYRETLGFISGVAFEEWDAEKADQSYGSIFSGVAPYEPGQFYKRELPCILCLLEEHSLKPDIIIIDGFVTLNAKGDHGLGMHLFNALNGACPVIGVAKRSFKETAEQCRIMRGNSGTPLYVTCAGMELEKAKKHIISMYGSNRQPVLLKEVDRLCRKMEREYTKS